LPVVDQDRLVGIVTSYDFLAASARLFKEKLASAKKARALARGV
jgi:CBS domain-containing protein